MRLPINPDLAIVLTVGEAEPKLEFGSTAQRTTRDGVPLWVIPVLLAGTGERQDPTIKVTLPSAERPAIKRAETVKLHNLVASTWTIQNNGRERSGVSFSADAIEVVKTR